MRRRNAPNRSPLMVSVWAEIGAGRISEAFIQDKNPDAYVDGVCEGSEITVNPVHQTVDTLVHEVLHRLYPQWKENYVRRTTSLLRNQMTDEETVRLYNEYQKRVKRLKHSRTA